MSAPIFAAPGYQSELTESTGSDTTASAARGGSGSTTGGAGATGTVVRN